MIFRGSSGESGLRCIFRHFIRGMRVEINPLQVVLPERL